MCQRAPLVLTVLLLILLHRVAPQSSTKRLALVRYIEDVRPKSAVPVAALEWRIKEDVSVKILAATKAAHVVGAGPREEVGSESSKAGQPEKPASCYE